MNGFNKKDIVYEYTRGSGPGGQHRNKTDSCVTAIHEPTGLSVRIDGRSQPANKKKAVRELEKLYKKELHEKRAKHKKLDRDYKIKNTKVVRTYNYKRNEVKDHRSKKTADIDKFLDGQVDFRDFAEDE